ncbi:hypothetical protein DMP23_00330 [Amycolatopsis sp. A1MSW2902]
MYRAEGGIVGGDSDRPRSLTSRAVSTLLAILVVAFGLTSFSPPVDPAARSAALTPADRDQVTCDRAAVMNRQLDQLGRSGFTWTIAEPPYKGLWGLVDLYGTMQVRVSPRTPCNLMVDVVNHEWMHTRQWSKYGHRTIQAYGDGLEPVADCGSKLLGSTFTPYLRDRGFGCTDSELASARSLLGRTER